MDHQKYYHKRQDGSYSVHFANNNGLSLEEVRQIFSQYGYCLSVDNRGSEFGLCFIRYKTLEEVQRCLDGIKRNPTISILPQKNKINSNGVTKKTYNKTDNVKHVPESSTKSESDSNKKQSSSKIGSGILNFLEQRRSNRIKHDDTHSESFSDISSLSFRRSIIGDNEHFKTDKDATGFTQFEKPESLVNSTFKPSSSNKFNRIFNTDEIPDLVSAEQKSPALSTFSSQSSKMAKYKIIPAQHVIVANVHQKFGIHYILHLFEKHNPISVSLMKTTPVTNIRYCHVYFKMSQEAAATEKEFDNFPLCGNNLIVLTQERLIEEAYSM